MSRSEGYYCFNSNCNNWGECPADFAVLLVWPAPGYFPNACPSCEHGLYYHDNW